MMTAPDEPIMDLCELVTDDGSIRMSPKGALLRPNGAEMFLPGSALRMVAAMQTAMQERFTEDSAEEEEF